MSASIQAAQIIKCTFAGISCLSSTFIVFMILTEPETGLASPYSRIIFALSISDVLFSLGYLLSPFMSPKDNLDALFAIGTTESCEAIGFLLIIGMHCLISYTVFLTYYFMRRIRYKVTPQDFTKKEEKYFHVFIILASFSMAISTLATGSINPQAYGSICGIGSYPIGCEKDETVECERGGSRVNKILRMYSVSFGIALFTTLIVILALSIHHVFRVERSFTRPARGIGNVERNPSNRQQGIQDDGVQHPEQGGESNGMQDVEQHVDDLTPNNNTRQNDLRQMDHANMMVLTKQALHQSLFYIAAFSIVYLAPMISFVQKIFRIEDQSLDELRFWFSALFTPLGGVFNILIYTRPKVLKMREKYPDLSWIRLFLSIVITGGDIPSMADVRPRIPTSEELRSHEQNQHYEDEEDDDDSQNSVIREIIVYYDMDISSASEYLSKDLSIGSSIVI